MGNVRRTAPCDNCGHTVTKLRYRDEPHLCLECAMAKSAQNARKLHQSRLSREAKRKVK